MTTTCSPAATPERIATDVPSSRRHLDGAPLEGPRRGCDEHLVRSLFMSSAELGTITCCMRGARNDDGAEHIGLERIVGIGERDANLVAA